MTESPDVIIGEVLPDEKADGKKKQLVSRKSDNVAFGSFITKSNDLIQRTKYSLPRNEQKILFMMLSKIDQRHDMDASKYYTISFDDFAKLTGVNALDSGYANYLRKTIENLENRMFWVPLGNDQYKTMSWVNRHDERLYIQSAYALPDKEKVDQEQASLLNINDGFRKLIIVGDRYRSGYNEEGILMMSLSDFLLGKENKG